MKRDAAYDVAKFKSLFLNTYFPIYSFNVWKVEECKNGYQCDLHKWTKELKYLNTLKITEEAINLIKKHFLIDIQSYL